MSVKTRKWVLGNFVTGDVIKDLPDVNAGNVYFDINTNDDANIDLPLFGLSESERAYWLQDFTGYANYIALIDEEYEWNDNHFKKNRSIVWAGPILKWKATTSSDTINVTAANISEYLKKCHIPNGFGSFPTPFIDADFPGRGAGIVFTGATWSDIAIKLVKYAFSAVPPLGANKVPVVLGKYPAYVGETDTTVKHTINPHESNNVFDVLTSIRDELADSPIQWRFEPYWTSSDKNKIFWEFRVGTKQQPELTSNNREFTVYAMDERQADEGIHFIDFEYSSDSIGIYNKLLTQSEAGGYTDDEGSVITTNSDLQSAWINKNDKLPLLTERWDADYQIDATPMAQQIASRLKNGIRPEMTAKMTLWHDEHITWLHKLGDYIVLNGVKGGKAEGYGSTRWRIVAINFDITSNEVSFDLLPESSRYPKLPSQKTPAVTGGRAPTDRNGGYNGTDRNFDPITMSDPFADWDGADFDWDPTDGDFDFEDDNPKGPYVYSPTVATVLQYEFNYNAETLNANFVYTSPRQGPNIIGNAPRNIGEYFYWFIGDETINGEETLMSGNIIPSDYSLDIYRSIWDDEANRFSESGTKMSSTITGSMLNAEFTPHWESDWIFINAHGDFWGNRLEHSIPADERRFRARLHDTNIFTVENYIYVSYIAEISYYGTADGYSTDDNWAIPRVEYQTVMYVITVDEATGNLSAPVKCDTTFMGGATQNGSVYYVETHQGNFLKYGNNRAIIHDLRQRYSHTQLAGYQGNNRYIFPGNLPVTAWVWDSSKSQDDLPGIVYIINVSTPTAPTFTQAPFQPWKRQLANYGPSYYYGSGYQGDTSYQPTRDYFIDQTSGTKLSYDTWIIWTTQSYENNPFEGPNESWIKDWDNRKYYMRKLSDSSSMTRTGKTNTIGNGYYINLLTVNGISYVKAPDFTLDEDGDKATYLSITGKKKDKPATPINVQDQPATFQADLVGFTKRYDIGDGKVIVFEGGAAERLDLGEDVYEYGLPSHYSHGGLAFFRLQEVIDPDWNPNRATIGEGGSIGTISGSGGNAPVPPGPGGGDSGGNEPTTPDDGPGN